MDAAQLSAEAKDELEALLAIYGDDGSLVKVSGGTVTLVVESGDRARVVTLECVLGSGYPSAPMESMDCDGKKGVPGEMLRALRAHLAHAQQELSGMPVLFSLAEAAKQFLDGAGANGGAVGADSEDEETREENSRPLNHQVGNPLIMEGTRCTENVFLAWREGFLERRAAEMAARAEAKAREQGSGLTGKEMFVRGLVQLKNEGALADAAEMEAVERGANLLASIDASLFVDE